MKEGLRKLYAGEFNSGGVEILPDGTRRITLSSDGENKVYRFTVQNLYLADEKVLEHEVLNIDTPEFIKERMKETDRLP
jgi:hypothetical protein